jgi:hypothetical protein
MILSIIVIVWLLLTIPIVKEVEKKLNGFDRLTFVYTLWQSIWNVPVYYYLTIKELFTNKK